MSEIIWYVAHTRPRCEKKLADYCERESIAVTLPLFRSVKKYRGKKVVFEKPLFPSYLFVRMLPEKSRKVRQNDYVANLLDVVDQELFESQLDDILLAIEAEAEIVMAPYITAGARVKIKSGPLRGVEGYVETREGQCHVILRLDFIGQAAAVKVDASEVELI
ncbi:MAG: hypothetical protein O2960_07565 [Verrucomicrobia bacterium]|nr:hypothetical protein [Verrucomicrobiota bacterium]